jgi:hypothetical protein
MLTRFYTSFLDFSTQYMVKNPLNPTSTTICHVHELLPSRQTSLNCISNGILDLILTQTRKCNIGNGSF